MPKEEEVRSRLFRTRDESIASPPNVFILPGGWGGFQERIAPFYKLNPVDQCWWWQNVNWMNEKRPAFDPIVARTLGVFRLANVRVYLTRPVTV